MSFLPKDLRYPETDLTTSYNDLARQQKKLIEMLDGMTKKKDPAETIEPKAKRDSDFRMLPPSRGSRVPPKEPPQQEGGFFDSILLKLGCIKR